VDDSDADEDIFVLSLNDAVFLFKHFVSLSGKRRQGKTADNKERNDLVFILSIGIVCTRCSRYLFEFWLKTGR